MKEKLTHIDESGKARMVDVTEKSDTNRIAIAEGKIYMKKATLDMIESAEIAKGDVLAVARIAGIMSAKRTSEFIPLCHTILLTKVGVDFESFSDDNTGITIRVEVMSTGKTGVEMEALTAVSVSALTIYDMCKAVDRGMSISEIRLLEKRGGKSGTWKAD
ncbi:MAG: cyclic pyranopterin monophosphate synthase MoaC [Candidatus Poribacteria bacterium]